MREKILNLKLSAISYNLEYEKSIKLEISVLLSRFKVRNGHSLYYPYILRECHAIKGFISTRAAKLYLEPVYGYVNEFYQFIF